MSFDESVEYVITQLIPYDGDCPKCGGPLASPDGNEARRCVTCKLTVNAAVEQWSIGRWG